MRLIFKNLNILRTTLNAISMSLEISEIVGAAGNNLPNLFEFASFALLWREEHAVYIQQEESCPAPFNQEVVKNMLRVFSTLAEEPIRADQPTLHVEKRRLKPQRQWVIPPDAALQSHLTLPLAAEGELLGCTTLASEQSNAFDAQDLQFFSVIAYQMAATLKQFQRFSSIKNMAIYDTLTKLFNRRYFEERITVEEQKAVYGGTPLSLILVDIDHFKKVNDTFGHGEGDQVLIKIGSLLKNSVRNKDTVARYGGEEFIVMLPGADLEVSSRIAERIRRLVESTLFDLGKARLNLTVSLGISNFPHHGARSKEELIRMADEALYEAKRGGRNRVTVYKPTEEQ
jgi:diguanylate cyclase (GGDEF)-like protein